MNEWDMSDLAHLDPDGRLAEAAAALAKRLADELDKRLIEHHIGVRWVRVKYDHGRGEFDYEVMTQPAANLRG
jgi:hypothetical protein